MHGLMMDRPLLVSMLIEHAGAYHGDQEIVSRTVQGPLHRYTYRDAERRAKQLANALRRLGVSAGDRIGTLAWNTYRHYELYFGVSGIGAICHTINPRLFQAQVEYIINHAEDRLLFVDLTFVPLLEQLSARLGSVAAIVVMTDAAHMPRTSLQRVLCYETLIAAEPAELEWPQFSELNACSLCYTSGTTGNPKGALYSHRSTLLHALGVNTPDGIGLSARDVICPIVPMFHVNAWAVPYTATMTGAKLVLPGPALDGASLFELFETEAVTFALGVPTVWLGLLEVFAERGRKPAGLERMVIGGSAAPATMIEALEGRYGITVIHGWGMTEMSPVGTTSALKRKHTGRPPAEQWALKALQGRPLFGVEMKIVDADGQALAHDGRRSGELLVRGPWIISAYYHDQPSSQGAFDDAGWFRTGDIAAIDPDGYLRITDRSKDVIKSGGEWISSIDLENAAMAHPDVAEAAVIGVPHPKWGERPLLIVVPKPGSDLAAAAVLETLAGKVAKWMLPDAVLLADALPHTATGKLLKTQLREQFKAYQWPVGGSHR